MPKAIVAPRRSVRVGGEIIAPATNASEEEKRFVRRRPTRMAGPGEEVELPREEIDRLRRLGYLVDPAAKAPAVGEGPKFETSQGPNIGEA